MVEGAEERPGLLRLESLVDMNCGRGCCVMVVHLRGKAFLQVLLASLLACAQVTAQTCEPGEGTTGHSFAEVFLFGGGGTPSSLPSGATTSQIELITVACLTPSGCESGTIVNFENAQHALVDGSGGSQDGVGTGATFWRVFDLASTSTHVVIAEKHPCNNG